MAAPRLLRSLYFQVLVAITIGILLGAFAPQTGAAMKPLGDGFIKLIKMIISPVIFTTVVLGNCRYGGAEESRQNRRPGPALLRSGLDDLFAARRVDRKPCPPRSRHERRPENPRHQRRSRLRWPRQDDRRVKDFILNIIPTTFFDAFAKGEILQVLLLALLFGIALQQLGSRAKLMVEVVEKLSQVLFGIVGIIMRVAPIGAFGAMAFTVGAYGLGSLLSLSKLMATFYLTCVLFIFLVLGAIARVHGFSIFRYVYYIRDEILIVLGTSSSEAALPRMMAKIESLGAGRSTVGLVIPTAIRSIWTAHPST